MSTPNESASGFDSFDLHPALRDAVRKAGFDTPTPIQQASISAVMDGRDVLGLAQTGTGKTAAFALPLLHELWTDSDRGIRALIVAPTRELVMQINDEIRMLAQFTKLKSITIFGGVSQHGQVKAIRRNPDIIVACPGRLLDLVNQGVLDLGQVKILVLDEADHMFDMGFLPDIRKIIKELPRERQNLLFSATMPPDIRKLANEILKDPEVYEVDFKGPAKTVSHALYHVQKGRKQDLLEHLLEEQGSGSTIVFTRMKHQARKVAEKLHKNGYSAVALQGNMSQAKRDRAMNGFRRGKFDILVATDIAARGIDVSQVTHVINFDIPANGEAYTHRIGRTGRAERDGNALTFVTSEDRGALRNIERTVGSPIEVLQVEGISDKPGQHDRRGGGGGGGQRQNRNARGNGGSGGGGGGGGQRRDGRPDNRSKRRRGPGSGPKNGSGQGQQRRNRSNNNNRNKAAKSAA